jgi:DNA-binding CsgD family transcriptional regulator/tetratricopeptide (TPR) repeat protein
MAQRVSSPVFVGRVPELERISTLLAEVSGRREGATVLVSGEAGVGKTRFIREIAARASNSGWTVLFGTSDEFGAEARPFAALREMLDAIESVLTRNAPDELERPAWKTLTQMREPRLSTGGGGSVIELAASLFQRIALSAPLMVVVDDLQWADESTRKLFEVTARSLTRSAAVVVGSYRGNEVARGHPLRPVLGVLHRLVRPHVIELVPFDERETGEVVRAIGGPSGSAVRELWSRSGGNAFLLEELVASRPGALPNGVREVVLARLDALSREAIQVAEFASLDSSVAFAVLAEVVMLGPVGLAAAVDGLIAQGFLTEESAAFRFRHPLLREVIYEAISPVRRPLMHRAMAEALQRCDPGRHGEIARHWHEAGDESREFVAVLHAGKVAKRMGAMAEASDFNLRALDLWDLVAEPSLLAGHGWPQLITRTSELLTASRRFDRAEQLTRDALGRLDGLNRNDQCLLLSAAGMALFYGTEAPSVGSDTRAAMALIERAMDLLDETVEPQTAVTVLTDFSAQAMHLGRDADALRATDRAVRIARHGGDASLQAMALLWRAMFRARQGDEDAGSDLVEAREQMGLPFPVRTVGRAMVLHFLGHDEAAIAEGSAASERLFESGHGGVGGYQAEEPLCRSLARLGRFGEVIDRYHGLCRRIGEDQVHAWPDLVMLDFSLSFVRTGRTEEAWEFYERAAKWILPFHEVWMMGGFALLGVELARLGCRVDRSRAALAEVLPHVREASLATCGEAIAFAVGLEADAASTGLAEKARALALADMWIAQLAGELTEHPARARFEDLAMFIEQAELERARLFGDDRSERWQDLANRWDALPRPYHAAYARFRAAFALVTAHVVVMNGAHARATELLASALATCKNLGAVALEAEVLRLMKSVGVRPSKTPTPVERGPSIARSAHGLTARELDVLRLLVGGDSNGRIAMQLGISVKTASVHVSNILQKLEAKNRVEAAMRATGLGIVPSVVPSRRG